MSDTAEPRSDLVEKLRRLAEETGSSAAELADAVDAYAAWERRFLEAVDEGLREEEGGAPGRPAEEVFAELDARLRARAGHK